MTMSLHWSPASPFARKVMACAIARGVKVETTRTDPHSSPEVLLRANPLSKVPALVLDDGSTLYDSPVVCEYLDAQGAAPPLFPPVGPKRWRALLLQALGDGLMDAAVARRMQGALPAEEARQKFMDRQKAAVERGLDSLEADPPAGLDDIGDIAVACALGYLDFRFAHEPWRATRPKLAAWFARVSELAPLKQTEPA
jgi:glutathione S-transferase